jgi:uncharacterized protein YuzE
LVDIDREHDLAYILLRPELRGRRGAVARSVRAAKDIVLDLDENGRLIGIELLNASARLDVHALETGTREIIVGVKEAAEMLGVEKSNFVRDYANKSDFPAPVAELASGRFWLRSTIEQYVEAKKSSRGRGRDTMDRGEAMLQVVEDVYKDGRDLVRGWRLLDHARDSLRRGGAEELKRYFERCLHDPRGQRMHAMLTRKGRKTLESEYPRFLAAYNSRP